MPRGNLIVDLRPIISKELKQSEKPGSIPQRRGPKYMYLNHSDLELIA